ncbi:MAG: hypothetical protein M5U07_21080 [Xanthobacteraceae bacterium]|nr:hypothetical protein [Xanthobacteraceae bacterium]
MTPVARPDQADWGREIRAIAGHQDRAAFAALFGYFAPRIKTFMQRSGLGEAQAEEDGAEHGAILEKKGPHIPLYKG